MRSCNVSIVSRNRWRIALLAVLAFGALPLSAVAEPADAVYAIAAKVVNAINKGDAKTISALVAPNVAVVDDFAPFAFPSFDVWSSSFDRMAKANNITDPVITITKSPFIAVAGSAAYAPLPTTFTFKQDGKSMTQRGLLVFRFAKRASGWLVTSVTWGRSS